MTRIIPATVQMTNISLYLITPHQSRLAFAARCFLDELYSFFSLADFACVSLTLYETNLPDNFREKQSLHWWYHSPGLRYLSGITHSWLSLSLSHSLSLTLSLLRLGVTLLHRESQTAT